MLHLEIKHAASDKNTKQGLFHIRRVGMPIISVDSEQPENSRWNWYITLFLHWPLEFLSCLAARVPLNTTSHLSHTVGNYFSAPLIYCISRCWVMDYMVGLPWSGLEIGKKFSRNFATSFRNLVANWNILVAKVNVRSTNIGGLKTPFTGFYCCNELICIQYMCRNGMQWLR